MVFDTTHGETQRWSFVVESIGVKKVRKEKPDLEYFNTRLSKYKNFTVFISKQNIKHNSYVLTAKSLAPLLGVLL